MSLLWIVLLVLAYLLTGFGFFFVLLKPGNLLASLLMILFWLPYYVLALVSKAIAVVLGAIACFVIGIAVPFYVIYLAIRSGIKHKRA